jgi:hypothetical protein
MQFGKLNIHPARNPAVLDTATWDPANAWDILRARDNAYWTAVLHAVARGEALPPADGISFHAPSRVRWQDSTFCLAALADGQQVLIELGSGRGQSVLGEPMGRLSFTGVDLGQLAAYKTDLGTVARYIESIDPSRAPQVLGAESRLGIGCRMTTASWPGIYRAMAGGGFAANAIQNSVRETNVLEDLLAGRPADLNYGPNLGTFASGHAGSSFEGLWLYGVLEALKCRGPLRYGADADHMQVKRDVGQFERALRVLSSVRHYTFYTMDVSDILDYVAVQASPATVEEYLARVVPHSSQRRDLLAYHRQPQPMTGRTLQPDDLTTGRFVGKYWDALGAMEKMTERIGQVKAGRPYDLEFAVDEVPAGVMACDCITSHEELLFIIRECQRRELPVTHIAPNFGIEKEMDYRCPDGLEGLGRRVRDQTEMARTFNLMLDFHSGDDLSATTRRVIGRATQGHNQFKVSPSLQLLYAETLEDLHPEVFRVWWDDTLAFARREAECGSPLATRGIEMYNASSHPGPSAQHEIFRHYCFASVGRRDEHGQFVHREMFYDLSSAFYHEYEKRLVAFLGELADDLFHRE